MTARTAGRTAIVSRISVRRAPIAVVIAAGAFLLQGWSRSFPIKRSW
jgi:hypothetical protein